MTSPQIGWKVAALASSCVPTMTFYEAAIQILLREGRPLHAREITELALEGNLLSHIGKQPEVVMASRLAAMARRSHDKRLVAVEPDVFALSDWNVPTSADALEQSGVIAEPDEASQPLLRSLERHPAVSRDNVRVLGRGDRRRREEFDRKRRRAPQTLPELITEILEEVGFPLPLFELAAALREKDLVEDDLGREALESKLLEENDRLETAGSDVAFSFLGDGLVGLPGAEVPGEERDVAASLEAAVSKIARGRRPRAAAVQAAEPAVGGIARLVADSRQNATRQLRSRLAELDADGLGQVAARLFDVLGYRDVRVAKRHREGALFTMRRRMGLVEVRFAIRVLRGNRDVLREDVAELRGDLLSHSAQMGVIFSPSDPTREARAEASQPGQSLVVLLCADALAEQLVEKGIGVTSQTVTLVEYDPRGLSSLLGGRETKKRETSGSKARRETTDERKERRDKERRDWRERRQKAREARKKSASETEETKGDKPHPPQEGGQGSIATGDTPPPLPKAPKVKPDQEPGTGEAGG